MKEFKKSTHLKPAFSVTASGGLQINQGVFFGDADYSLVPVLLPSMVGGEDYKIFIGADGTPKAIHFDSAITDAGAKVLGGFHYSPGGLPMDFDLGGNNSPAINPYSIWDLKYRPDCASPRGMTKILNSNSWVDIYFLNVNHHANGTSRNNKLIATGENPPERAYDFGGYGSSKYKNFIWWNAAEVMAQHGKRLGRYDEHCLAAFGVKENEGRGNHPINTGLNTYNASAWAHDYFFTSKCGVIQATGCVWVWTESLSDWEGTPATSSLGWDAYNVTGGHIGSATKEPNRGSLILQNSDDLTSILFGGKWNYTSKAGTLVQSGSRCAETIEKLWDNSSNLAARGFANHHVEDITF